MTHKDILDRIAAVNKANAERVDEARRIGAANYKQVLADARKDCSAIGHLFGNPRWPLTSTSDERQMCVICFAHESEENS